ncbi:MAG TPA: amylo-alpha-1,6-glucosidase [Phycisphaerales bacterium]|nr:amylo-alpha-1,6-glucosidase [Phycisphaerales bacterium]
MPRAHRDPQDADASFLVRAAETTPGALTGAEWLLASGLGGFAMGTPAGLATRRYHALLVASLQPPVRRVTVLAALADSAQIDFPTGPCERIWLTPFCFAGAARPACPRALEAFELDPAANTARWTYRVADAPLVKELTLVRGTAAAVITYRLAGPPADPLRLEVRPLLSLTDFHHLLRHDPDRFRTRAEGGTLAVASPDGLTAWIAARGGVVSHHEQWWHDFHYPVERERGLDHTQDLFSPACVVARLAGPAETLTIALSLAGAAHAQSALDLPAQARTRPLPGRPAVTVPPAPPRAAMPPADDPEDPALPALRAAAAQFLTVRAPLRPGEPAGLSLVAGYPWFADWGRDTLISIPGLLLASSRLDDARAVLTTWSRHIRRGLVPNRFDDHTAAPHYNAADASLWFLSAACDYARASADPGAFARDLLPPCLDIVRWYRRGTDSNIGLDTDGLVRAGDPATQLTWMDAARDGVVFTPRSGKPIELSALWHHGLLRLAETLDDLESSTPFPGGSSSRMPGRARRLGTVLRSLAARTGASFTRAFFDPVLGCCVDRLEPDRATGSWRRVPEVRPNQLLALCLEHSPLRAPERARALRTVTERLLTPWGVRTLDPSDPGYVGRYRGRLRELDAAYHNGTAWPWLLGPLAEATLRVGGFSPPARARARAILEPVLALARTPTPGVCLGSLPEVADGDHAPGAPQRAGGCPAQAWSVAETLRVLALLRGPAPPGPPAPRA